MSLTKAGIEAANSRFVTIEPNTGVVPVPAKGWMHWQR